MPLARFCPHCGTPVRRLTTSSGCCLQGHDVFANSLPTAGVFLVRDDEILLIRRGIEPGKGKWDIPGGFLEEGEAAEDGARREIREELGLELDSLHLVLTSINPLSSGAVLDILFESPAPDGDPEPASDAAAYAWFPINCLPEDIAFESSRKALERWRADRRAAGVSKQSPRVAGDQKAQ